MSTRKLTLARAFDALGLNAAGLALQRALRAPCARAVNYHDVPPSQAAAFEAQLDWYVERFECLDEPRLLGLLDGTYAPGRPGLVLTFDDGLRSHAEVVAPLLERRGLTGWFMVPTGFVDEAPDRQAEFARNGRIGHAGHDWGDPRVALSWEQVEALASRHVIGCHTVGHRRLAASLGPAELDREIREAKTRLEARLAREVDVFTWVGGEEASYSRAAAESIAAAGFRLSFMSNNQLIRPGTDPLQIQRTNVESSDPPPVVRFQLSGAMDLLYAGKRSRVNALTRVGRG